MKKIISILLSVTMLLSLTAGLNFSAYADNIDNFYATDDDDDYTAHQYTETVVAPTCTEQGYTLHQCVCGEEYKDNYTDSTGHSWDNGTVTKQATCKATGVTTYNCVNCDETKTESINKLAHSYKTTTTQKATASKNGTKTTKCTVGGETKSTSTIYAASKITLSKTSFTYNGKVQKPTVTVKDSKGNKIATSNYTVSFASGCKNVGSYKVTIKLKGNYSGTVTKTFKINPKNTTISSVKSTKSKSFTVKWKKYTTQTTGYQIQYSTDKNFKKNNKTVTVSKNSTTSKTVTGLTANKKYYVRIRTYKTVGKTKYYSSWSGSKTVTTKK